MKKLNQIMEDLNKPLTKEQIEKVIYNFFCIAIMLLPIIPEKFGYAIYSLKNTIFNMVTIITSIALLILNIKSTKVKLNIYDILVAIYLILVALSTIFSKYGIREGILGENGRGEGFTTIFSYIATFVICLKGYKHINKTLKVGIIAAVIVSIYGIIQANTPIEIELPFGTANSEGVAEGTMGNQNCLSSYLCIFLPMMCYYFLNTKHYTSAILLGILFAAFIFARTLGGYLVFIAMYIAISVFSLIYAKQKKTMVIKILLMTLFLAAIFMTINYAKSEFYIAELAGAKQEASNLAEGSENFGTSRMAIWKRTAMAINNNKLLGVGPDSLANELEQEKYKLQGEQDFLAKYRVDKAHSEYLHIAVTTGIPSVIIYLVLLSIICIRLAIIVFKVNKPSVDCENKTFITMIGIGIVSYLAQAAGNISVVQVVPVFWLILGLGAGITLHEKNVIKKIEK